MTDLKQECLELRSIAAKPVSQAALRKAREALSSKFESIQAEGAKALSAWGGREAVAALQQWLLRCMQKPYGWSVRGVAVRSLARCIEPLDAGWVLDLYFAQTDPVLRAELLPVASAVPPSVAHQRIEVELGSLDPVRRQGAVVLRNRLQGLGR